MSTAFKKVIISVCQAYINQFQTFSYKGAYNLHRNTDQPSHGTIFYTSGKRSNWWWSSVLLKDTNVMTRIRTHLQWALQNLSQMHLTTQPTKTQAPQGGNWTNSLYSIAGAITARLPSLPNNTSLQLKYHLLIPVGNPKCLPRLVQ